MFDPDSPFERSDQPVRRAKRTTHCGGPHEGGLSRAMRRIADPWIRPQVAPGGRYGAFLAIVRTTWTKLKTEETSVDLTVWIPATFLLGLTTLALMSLFIDACDRV